MPGHKVHVYFDRMFFGKSYWKLHRAMDEPVFYLGRSHRVLFHDPVSAYAIASELYPGDENAVGAAQNHILLDEMCSQDPLFKKQFEILARSEGKKKKEKRDKTPKEWVPILRDLKKMDEARKLLDRFHSLG